MNIIVYIGKSLNDEEYDFLFDLFKIYYDNNEKVKIFIESDGCYTILQLKQGINNFSNISLYINSNDFENLGLNDEINKIYQKNTKKNVNLINNTTFKMEYIKSISSKSWRNIKIG